jgi:SNF2 family DNA or RNA helicase
MLSRDDLHEYQRKAVSFVVQKRRCGLFLDMGLGKTVSTLTAISDLRDGFLVGRTLVIAPLRVANSVWAQEARRWDHLRHLRVSVCTGSDKVRRMALNVTADIYVINRENTPWLVKLYGDAWPFDMVVIDESSSFKTPSTQRFKALRRALPYIETVVLLTGTPTPNGLLDIWSQMYLIDFGQRLGRTFTGYKTRFFDPDYWGRKFTPRAGSDDAIHDLISDCVMHMSADDYLEVPDRIDVEMPCQMPSGAADDYREFERTMLAEFPDGEVIEAKSAATLLGKLLQWANGAVYLDETGRWTVTHDAKLDALGEIVETNPDEPILVAYNFKSDLARLVERFPNAVALDKDPATIDRWNRGEIPILLAHPASAGHGLNLQGGGSICVWFGLTWSLEYYQQFNARLHRQGQTRPVRVIHITSEDTVDQRVLAALADKDATQRKLLDALDNRADQV